MTVLQTFGNFLLKLKPFWLLLIPAMLLSACAGSFDAKCFSPKSEPEKVECVGRVSAGTVKSGAEL